MRSSNLRSAPRRGARRQNLPTPPPPEAQHAGSSPGGFLAAIAVLVSPCARWPQVWNGRWGDRPYLLADLLMLVLPIVIWVFFREPVDSKRVTVSLLTYPAYALLQLAAFLVLPSIPLQVLGMSRRAIAIVCATMFALIHWPNPAVMVPPSWP